MEQPHFVFKTLEGVLEPKNRLKHKTYKVIGYVLLVIIFLLMAGSFVFGENLFKELSFSAVLLLISLSAFILIARYDKILVSSEIEFYFYKDHFVVYRPKYHGLWKEVYNVKYDNVSRCLLKNNRIHIYGDFQFTKYIYNGDICSQVPSTDKYVTRGIIFFNTEYAPEVDFVRLIEGNSSIKVQ